ncbi:UDP-N-acetylgalactosamine-undecaprenyl-phosphate N-acetylgalactosaminephosphotransferase [Veillonella atypica]|uniref:UDP-N-acetylgalactosamine-undecaprenyl-phosphate N-acetylgalactosaminephosphotransferase n=2 Tax=Veillonella atypica TaxID=39777 RepID=A0A6N2YSF3_9FIRM
MQCEAVRPYYDILASKRRDLMLKSVFDRLMAAILLVVLSPIFLLLAVWIKLDSEGPVFFRQERVTQYGKSFRIYKFRTMVQNAEQLGTQVTSKDDMRVTSVGQALRKCRLDELPQLINILEGTMSFVGTRPEVPRYVAAYTDEMKATLLLPAGVTSVASIRYKDEDILLDAADDVDDCYIHNVLPAKMEWNLRSLKEFSFIGELKVMVETVLAVIR